MSHINWVEIPVLDLNRASKFYEKVFSVRIEDANIGDVTHGIMKMSGEVGGILFETDKIYNGVTIYFHVDRLNEIIEKTEIFGGKIVLNKTLLKSYNSEDEGVIKYTMFDGKMGYFAKIEDTEGNIIGLHSNS